MAAELLQQVNTLRLHEEGNGSGTDWSRRIVGILQVLGCTHVEVDHDKMSRMHGSTNFWFSGHCRGPEGKRVDVGVQRHGNSLFVDVDMGHTRCFYGVGVQSRCVSDSLVNLPGH